VELDALPRGEPERAVAVAIGELVERQILRRRQPAAGDAHAHHQLRLLAQALLLELGGAVAVIALVDAVEFEQHGGLAAEGRRVAAELVRERAAQAMACELDLLDLGGTAITCHRQLLPRGHREDHVCENILFHRDHVVKCCIMRNNSVK
jgi:hypothetical protein